MRAYLASPQSRPEYYYNYTTSSPLVATGSTSSLSDADVVAQSGGVVDQQLAQRQAERLREQLVSRAPASVKATFAGVQSDERADAQGREIERQNRVTAALRDGSLTESQAFARG
jgi:hypothetical protein